MSADKDDQDEVIGFCVDIETAIRWELDGVIDVFQRRHRLLRLKPERAVGCGTTLREILLRLG